MLADRHSQNVLRKVQLCTLKPSNAGMAISMVIPDVAIELHVTGWLTRMLC